MKRRVLTAKADCPYCEGTGVLRAGPIVEVGERGPGPTDTVQSSLLCPCVAAESALIGKRTGTTRKRPKTKPKAGSVTKIMRG